MPTLNPKLLPLKLPTLNQNPVTSNH